jgi:hypothetical protein
MAQDRDGSWASFTRALGRLGGAASGEPASPLDAEDERTLACLGASVILHWSQLDRDLQRSLFEAALAASSEPDEREFRHHLALVLHEHHPRTAEHG